MELTAANDVLVSINPATGQALAIARPETAREVEAKVSGAREASSSWRTTPLPIRLTAIRAVHHALARDAGRMAKALSDETGRPVQESLGAEALPTLRGLEFLCRRAASHLGPARLPERGMSAMAEPHGVIGVIGTWNYPLFLNLVSICQALAAGNTVVWKPSELAIHSARETQRLFEAAGLPPGVLEVAFGGADTGRALVRADCDKFLFTGGVRTGREILAELAQSGKPAVMELSGCDAFIACEDAPLDLAARSAVWGRVCNAGQSCVAPQRFYVHRAVCAPFLNRVRAHLEALHHCELTPLRTAAARERCHGLVRSAVEHGARLIHGGAYDPELPGFYYAPTLLGDCDDNMDVMREDLFGPVIAVCPVDNEREAIDRANANPLALGASLWTRDKQRAARMAGELRVGLVSVNSVLLDAANPAVSFGGLRSSGFGKQRGAQGLEEMVCRKVIAMHGPSGERRHLFPYLPAAEEILMAMTRMRLTGRIKSGWELVCAAMAWQRQSSDFNAVRRQSSRASQNSPRAPSGHRRA